MSDFAIRGIEIHQIGVFDNFRLEFPEKKDPTKAEIHIFTGGNGSGKSTLLELLAGLFFSRESERRILARFRSIHDSSFIVITNNEFDPWYYNNFGRLDSRNSLALEFKTYLDKLQGDQINTEFDFALFAYSGYRKLSSTQLSGIVEIDKKPMEGALDFTTSANPRQLLQWIANMKNSEYRAIAKGQADKAEIPIRMLKQLEEVISDIIGQKVEFDLEENPIGVVVLVDGIKLNFDTLPDGLKSIVSWMGDLLMRMQRIRWKDNIPVFERRFVLFLDEIEVHLHPAWQRKILPIVQKLFVNAQIFISTHSPFVVGSIDGAWVYKLKFDGEKTTVAPPTLSEDGQSFMQILKAIFEVDEQFGVAVEKDLDEFYQLRNKALHSGLKADINKLESLATQLSGQSPELDFIVEMELRQVKRQLQLPKSA